MNKACRTAHCYLWALLVGFACTGPAAPRAEDPLCVPILSSISSSFDQLPPHTAASGFDADPQTLFHSTLGSASGHITLTFPNPTSITRLTFIAQVDQQGGPLMGRLPRYISIASDLFGAKDTDSTELISPQLDLERGAATFSIACPLQMERTLDIFVYGVHDCITFTDCQISGTYISRLSNRDNSFTLLLTLLLCILTAFAFGLIYTLRIFSRSTLPSAAADAVFPDEAGQSWPSTQFSSVCRPVILFFLNHPRLLDGLCFGLLCVGLIAILCPYLSNGFWFDDALNSLLSYRLTRFDETLWTFSWRVFSHWLTRHGRMMGCFLASYPLWYIATSLPAAKCLNLFLFLIGVFLFAVTMMLLGLSRRAAALWCVLTAASFQIHGRGLDPLAGFLFHYSLLSCQLGVSCVLLALWYTRNTLHYLLASLTVWLVFMTCYEINVVYLPIAYACAFTKARWQKPVLLITGVMLAYLTIYCYFRVHATGPSYSGSTFVLDSKTVWAYLKQLSAAPLSATYIFQTHSFLDPQSLFRLALKTPAAWAAYAAVLSACLACLPLKMPPRIVLCVAASMLFVPPVLIAVSDRYRAEIAIGVGALPVYYQYFGMALFEVCLLGLVARLPLGRPIIAVVIAAIAALNVTMNYHMVSAIDVAWRSPRDALMRASADGTLEPLDDNDTVTVLNAPHYIQGDLIFAACGKRVYVPGEDYSFVTPPINKSGRTFTLTYVGQRFTLLNQSP